MTRPRRTLEQLREAHDAAPTATLRARLRQRARQTADDLGEQPPDWCSAMLLVAPVADVIHTTDVARYPSLRAWAVAGEGARVRCWDPVSGRVTLVLFVTDSDQRAATFPSEQAALDAIHAGPIAWTKDPTRRANVAASSAKMKRAG